MKAGARFAKLSAREQRLLLALGATAALLVVLGLPLYVYGTVAAARQRNREIEAVLQEIDDARGVLDARRRESDELALRYARPAPPLAAFIENAAKDNGIEVPESKDRPEVPHGKRYVERVTAVRLRKTGMRELAKMLEKMEQSGYPIAITRLGIKKRSTGPDVYDVELAVSAFDRKPEGGAGSGSKPEAGEGKKP
ncbi:MAG: hypothetical protein HY744_13500 [Deltaproteobacteria bacterium]|nr:hypothetical protein [Deltaproteobacteria bacterium]